jgi:CubicO group peptidase (beta-lactamase class C family)
VLPVALQPEEVGLSSQRLRRIGDAFSADAQQGKLPGAVVLVARHGKVAYFEAFAVQDPDHQAPMRRDGKLLDAKQSHAERVSKLAALALLCAE